MRAIALVGPELEENLGLRHLASALAVADFETRILPFNGERDLAPPLAALLAGEQPSVIALGLAFQWRAKDFLALAVALREAGYQGHITAGGHFATFEAHAILTDFPEVDTICRHEAEQTLVALARALDSGSALGEIPGLALRDSRTGEVVFTELPRPPDLENLPWPDRRGEPTRCVGHNIAPMVSSRGCYANCAFCCIAAWHEQTMPGKRYRSRPLEDVADEMAWLHVERKIDIFIFHDDNFFVPGHAKSLARVTELADALAARNVGHIGTVVKARPNDVTPELFALMVERLGCIRIFLGVENDSEPGLATLRRRVHQQHNHAAMATLRELGIYVCYNMLVFDPDATFASLETNLEFIEANGDFPCNFGRVELYAGTPLLARMQGEQRCTGDYMGWNYPQASAEMQRVFKLAMECFYTRNFAAGALANRLMGTRFDVEVCRHFEPDGYEPAWLERARSLSQRLASDSAQGMRRIMEHVRGAGPHASDESLVDDLSADLRHTEAVLRREATTLEQAVQRRAGATCMHARPTPWGGR